jgi:DNA-binding MarR family transcriptional regulator
VAGTAPHAGSRRDTAVHPQCFPIGNTERLSKSALSKHLSQLADAGYVTQDRAVRDSRNRLWLSLTPAGGRAYTAHVRSLRGIVDDTEG